MPIAAPQADENTSGTILETVNISLSYFDGDQTTFALRGLNLEISNRGFFGIMGPSGSGKSSLLYLLSGLKQPSEGEVIFRGRSLHSISESERTNLRRKRFGFVFQQPFLLNYLTARENVLLAARSDDPDREKHVDELLRELGISNLSARKPAHLSGGEKQRVVVARAMVNRPDIIFADEPTAALDHINGRVVVELLSRYRDRGTVIIVSHDPVMLTDSDQIFHLVDGSLDRIEYKLTSS